MTTKAPLYQYQADVLGQMQAGAPTYLGFDPGLGKSRTALEAAKRRGAQRILVICPASGRYVWERECRQWWPEMPVYTVLGTADLNKFKFPYGVVIVTYGLLSQRDSPYANIVAKGPTFDMTVLDEAAAVKNSGANRTKAILGRMLPKLGYLVPMSGTPAPNHAGELYPILKAVYPRALSRDMPGAPAMTEWDFQETFCKVVNKRFGGGRDVRVIEGSKNLPELKKRLTGFMIRVRKQDVLKDLPPLRWDVVPVQPIGVYAGLDVPEVPPGLSDDDLIKWLSGAEGQHVMKLRHLLGVMKTAPAVEYIDDFMINLPSDRKVLVFAHHHDVIRGLVSGLGDWSPVTVSGGTSPADRTIAIDKFLNVDRNRIFIGNIQAAGTGLTLVGPRCKCSDVIFVEATYSVGDNHQAACRVHRIGQRDAVVARMLTAHGTIDDRIQDILARKAQDFEILFN